MLKSYGSPCSGGPGVAAGLPGYRAHPGAAGAAVDSCAVCALHALLGQGGEKELEPAPRQAHRGACPGWGGTALVISRGFLWLGSKPTSGEAGEEEEKMHDPDTGRHPSSHTFVPPVCPETQAAGCCAVPTGGARSDPGAGPGSSGKVASQSSPASSVGKVAGGQEPGRGVKKLVCFPASLALQPPGGSQHTGQLHMPTGSVWLSRLQSSPRQPDQEGKGHCFILGCQPEHPPSLGARHQMPHQYPARGCWGELATARLGARWGEVPHPSQSLRQGISDMAALPPPCAALRRG